MQHAKHFIAALNEIVGDGTEEGTLLRQSLITDAALARDLIELDDTATAYLADWPAAREFVERVLTRHDITAPKEPIHDELTAAREDLGPDATSAEVIELAMTRTRVAANERGDTT